MSAETTTWLNNNVLVGLESKYGKAWHYAAAEQGEVSNHYPEGVPVADIHKRLFHWTLETSPIVLAATGETIPNKQAIYRSDTKDCFGIFGEESYNVHGYNEWLLDNVSTLLDAGAGDVVIGSAGLLSLGAIAWVQIEAPQPKMVGEEALRPFILATTSANGKLATSYKRGTGRVVCDNTLDEYHRTNKVGVKYKHSKRSLDRLAEARATLEIFFSNAEDEIAEIERLMNTSVTDEMMSKLMDIVLNPANANSKTAATHADKKRVEVLSLYKSNPMVNTYTGTAWGVVQAFNTWDQHFARVNKGTMRPERNQMAFLQGKVADKDNLVLEALQSILVP